MYNLVKRGPNENGRKRSEYSIKCFTKKKFAIADVCYKKATSLPKSYLNKNKNSLN